MSKLADNCEKTSPEYFMELYEGFDVEYKKIVPLFHEMFHDKRKGPIAWMLISELAAEMILSIPSSEGADNAYEVLCDNILFQLEQKLEQKLEQNGALKE